MHRIAGENVQPTEPSEPDGQDSPIQSPMQPDPADHPADDASVAASDAAEPATLEGDRHLVWHDDALHAVPGDGTQICLNLPAGTLTTSATPLGGRRMLEALEEASLPSTAEGLKQLLQFVKEAVARGQFYPSAHRTAEGVLASWRLLIADERDVERLEAMAAALPGICFSAADPKADRLELVEEFLTACCDEVVRRSLAKDEFFSNVHERAADPVADAEVRWVSSLLIDEKDKRFVRGRDIEVAALLDKVQTWTARLGDAGGEPWRLGFILVPPIAADDTQLPDEVEDEQAEPTESASTESAEAEETEPEQPRDWTLKLRLMPPYELAGERVPLPADQVWNQPAGGIGFIGRNAVRLRERLGSELQRSGEVCPPVLRVIGDDVTKTRPETISLTNGEAFLLIRDWAEDLREAGFHVDLPDWAGSNESRVEVVMDLRPADGDAGDWANGGSHMGLDSLLSFDWRVAVGGEELSPEDFVKMVHLRQPLIRRDGRWIEVDPQAAAAAAELIKKRPPGELTLGEAFRTGFGLGRLIKGDAAPAVRLAGAQWIEQLLDQTPDAKAKEIPQPESFDGQLRPYQLRGLQWLAFLDRLGLGGVLADDMGLGKTIQLIALLLQEFKEHEARGTLEHKRPTLLFVPTSVLGNWKRELGRFAPSLKATLHHGPQRLHGEAFAEMAKQQDVVITSYALAHRDVEDFQLIRWNRVALDEAQKIKNPQAASSQAVRSVEAPRRLALTGTPVENHLGELWSIMDMLNPGLLGTQGEFREKFSVPIERHGDRGRARRLREMIRPFVLRRTKDDPEVAADLPEKMEMNVYTGLTGEQAALYEKITGDMLGRIDTASGIRRRGLILSVLTKLKQVCDHPALVEEGTPRTLIKSGKALRLAEMLEEVIEEGERALIFTQYRQMGDLLVDALGKRLNKEILFLHGGTPQHKRDEMVLRFQSDAADAPPVFLLSLRAGGLGLNLTAASHVFHYDRWWNPAIENQATDRAHRIGQKKRVQVHKFVSIGTVEERIDRMLAEKAQLATNIVGSGDDWLTELDTTELKEYLSLSRDALSGGSSGDDDYDDFDDDPADHPAGDGDAEVPVTAEAK